MTGVGPVQPVTSVVVLDLDDTLYLERDYALSGFQAVGDWMERAHNIYGFGARAIDHFNAGRRTRVFDAVLSELGIVAEAGMIETLVRVYREHRPEIALQPDAAAFVRRARQGRALALLTDGFLVAQRNKISALGLGGDMLFPIVCTDVWGRDYWKPHVRGFRGIQAHHAVPAHACLYVADNPAKDFVAPRALGWRSIRIKRPQRLHDGPDLPTDCAADDDIVSFDELTDERLDRMLARPGVRAA